MRFFNSWKSPNIQWDKVEIRLRISAIDIIRLKYDHSDKYFEFKVLNLGIKAGGKRK